MGTPWRRAAARSWRKDGCGGSADAASPASSSGPPVSFAPFGRPASAVHSAPIYTVYALGSHPGYCYLGGMDLRIATPRRKVPVLKIPRGAVSIGGDQTGVSASDGPSGWNTIGSTQVAPEIAPEIVLDAPSTLVWEHADGVRDGLRLMREEAAGSSLADALRKASANEADPKTDLEHFFVELKAMTVNGYYTSEIGIHKDLEYVGNKYLGAFPGCTHEEHQG